MPQPGDGAGNPANPEEPRDRAATFATMNTSMSLSALNFYLLPLLAQVALAYAAAAVILVTRLRDIFGSGVHRSFYEEYSGVGGPVAVQRATKQLGNLFEFPVLFYALITLVVAANLRDGVLLGLAWAFVAARWVHTFVHLGFNMLWVRMTVFMLSNILLAAMWVRVAVIALGASAGA